MIKEIWESQVMPYEHACGDGFYILFPGINYNPSYCTLPRTWRQSGYNGCLQGVGVVQRRTATSEFVIWATAGISTDYWPGYDKIGWEMDGVTGAFLRFTTRFPNGLNNSSWWKVSRGGFIWSYEGYILQNSMAQKVPLENSFEYTGLVYDTTHFAGTWDGSFACIDEATNVVLLRTGATPQGHISLHNLTTGTLIRHLATCGTVKDAHWEFGNRAFVVSTTGVITLLDYVTGEILSVTTIALPAGVSFISTYDYILKRILIMPWSENAADGASTLKVHGYKNVPIGVRLTAPVPLQRLRTGQTGRLVTRMVGDVGEPINGGLITASLSNANASLLNTAASTDGTGYVSFPVLGNLDGTDTINVQGTVP